MKIHPPSLADIENLAETGWLLIPLELRRHAHDVVIRVVDLADDETLDALGMENPYELMGLYHGVALTEKSLSDPAPQPDIVFLYRLAILTYWCETGEDLGHIVRHVLIHEIGHHFGFSDEAMHALERSMDRLNR